MGKGLKSWAEKKSGGAVKGTVQRAKENATELTAKANRSSAQAASHPQVHLEAAGHHRAAAEAHREAMGVASDQQESLHHETKAKEHESWAKQHQTAGDAYERDEKGRFAKK